MPSPRQSRRSQRPERDLRPRVKPEFRQDVFDVGADRSHADRHPRGDLTIGQPLRHQPRHLTFARREPGRSASVVRVVGPDPAATIIMADLDDAVLGPADPKV